MRERWNEEEIEAIEESIAHWEAMREWVRTQPHDELASSSKMYKEIGQDWRGIDCALCELNLDTAEESGVACEKCPLAIAGFACDNEGSPWKAVSHAKTWGAWLVASDVMIAALKSLIDEKEDD
jgi:hypothetical protein